MHECWRSARIPSLHIHEVGVNLDKRNPPARDPEMRGQLLFETIYSRKVTYGDVGLHFSGLDRRPLLRNDQASGKPRLSAQVRVDVATILQRKEVYRSSGVA